MIHMLKHINWRYIEGFAVRRGEKKFGECDVPYAGFNRTGTE